MSVDNTQPDPVDAPSSTRSRRARSKRAGAAARPIRFAAQSDVDVSAKLEQEEQEFREYIIKYKLTADQIDIVRSYAESLGLPLVSASIVLLYV